MHKTDKPYINNSNAMIFVNEFLKDFQMTYPNVELKMLIVGGSAIAIKHAARGTVDIDAEIRTVKGIKQIIQRTSQRLQIYDDFINEDFMKSQSYSRYLWNDAICLYSDPILQVYVVSDLSQLCMKLTTNRNKDMADIKLLAYKLAEQRIGKISVDNKLEELYRGTVRVNRISYRTVCTIFKKYGLLNN